MAPFLISFLIFSAALFAAAYYVWVVPANASADVLQQRMRELRARSGQRRTASPDLIRREEQGMFAVIGDFLTWIGPLRRLQEMIDQANLQYRSTDVFVVSLGIAIVIYFLLGLAGMNALALRFGLAALFGALPTLYILRVRNRRLARFEEMLPDAIDLFNRSMKAGHNIQSGLETIAQESLDPVRMEFRKVIEEMALGSPVEDALHGLGKRVPVIDLKFFITGLILQRQTGANMVEVLDNMSLLIRERLNLTAKMHAATAAQRFSAGLLCAMPLVVGLGFWVMKPEYIRLLYTDETGSKFLTYAIVSELIGILIIRKIASPKL
ncbi:MAG: type II secretion system F family protein [Bryobacteraceae bacterium]|nr:type II secretion system F family protein [Bryobacteraceae bacterium]MDW8379481.1 type II secretion system F family protein [Bryobacterales bacterium]